MGFMISQRMAWDDYDKPWENKIRECHHID